MPQSSFSLPSLNLVVPTIVRLITFGTYTRPAGLLYAIIEMVGGGGSGGGVIAGVNPIWNAGAGGSSGGYARFLLTSAQIGATQAFVVGAGGAANSGASGSAGAATQFGTGGAIAQCNGGGGGNTSTSGSPFIEATSVAGGTATVTVGTILQTMTGQDGGFSWGRGLTPGTEFNMIAGTGGSNPLGLGGVKAGRANSGSSSTGAGVAGTGNGCGGSGTATYSTGGGPHAGGVGKDGVIIITEFFS